MTSYPGSIASFTTLTDSVDYPKAAHINDLQNEIVAIETALGTNFTIIYPRTFLIAPQIFNPADATTYYFGALNYTPTSTPTTSKIFIRKAGTIKKIDLYFIVITTFASAETSTVYFRLNDTTDTTISSAVNLSSNYEINASVSIAVSAGDYFEIKWISPTWATNPVGVLISAQVYME